jgi:hypothetical protein
MPLAEVSGSFHSLLHRSLLLISFGNRYYARMPKTPIGAKRPADVIGNAVHVMRIATGQIEDVPSKAPARAKGGKKGGAARALKLTDEQKADIARAAANARWKKS